MKNLQRLFSQGVLMFENPHPDIGRVGRLTIKVFSGGPIADLSRWPEMRPATLLEIWDVDGRLHAKVRDEECGVVFEYQLQDLPAKWMVVRLGFNSFWASHSIPGHPPSELLWKPFQDF